MPGTRANVKNEKRTTPSRTRACRSGAHRQFAESLEQWGTKSSSGGNAQQGGTTAQHKAAGRKGGRASAKS